MADCWELLFTELESFLSVSRTREANATVPVAEETLVKLEGYLHVLFTVLTTLREESREFKTISKNMRQCLATNLLDVLTASVYIHSGILPKSAIVTENLVNLLDILAKSIDNYKIHQCFLQIIFLLFLSEWFLNS